jgi:raffinose/stachyose/melibiose transport system substrate-binding protein
VQLWLDTAYGPTVGGAMNEGIVQLFAGEGTPEDIVQQMKDAAATL